jgi:hypothetical protein
MGPSSFPGTSGCPETAVPGLTASVNNRVSREKQLLLEMGVALASYATSSFPQAKAITSALRDVLLISSQRSVPD